MRMCQRMQGSVNLTVYSFGTPLTNVAVSIKTTLHAGYVSTRLCSQVPATSCLGGWGALSRAAVPRSPVTWAALAPVQGQEPQTAWPWELLLVLNSSLCPVSVLCLCGPRKQAQLLSSSEWLTYLKTALETF